MSGVIDSEASFFERFNELGLQEHTARFNGMGWNTFGKFAFSADYIPGSADSTPFDNAVAVHGLGNVNHPHKLIAKRLFFESYTLVLADLRRRTEQTSDAPPRRLPPPEREARHTRLQQRIQGVRIEGQREPSHQLQDVCNDQWDANVPSYISWVEEFAILFVASLHDRTFLEELFFVIWFA
jgi:hypothetical protein